MILFLSLSDCLDDNLLKSDCFLNAVFRSWTLIIYKYMSGCWNVNVHKNLSILLRCSLLILITKKKVTLLVVKASHTITFPSCTKRSEMNSVMFCFLKEFLLQKLSDCRTGKQRRITTAVCLTCEELTILLLSLHQSIHRTLLPCPFRVLRVFMTNWPRPSTFSATWCTAQTRGRGRKTSFVNNPSLIHLSCPPLAYVSIFRHWSLNFHSTSSNQWPKNPQSKNRSIN